MISADGNCPLATYRNLTLSVKWVTNFQELSILASERLWLKPISSEKLSSNTYWWPGTKEKRIIIIKMQNKPYRTRKWIVNVLILGLMSLPDRMNVFTHVRLFGCTTMQTLKL